MKCNIYLFSTLIKIDNLNGSNAFQIKNKMQWNWQSIPLYIQP